MAKLANIVACGLCLVLLGGSAGLWVLFLLQPYLQRSGP